MKMTKEELAARITGRDVSKTSREISKEEEEIAKDSGLFIICGGSDDLMEVYGVQREEYGAGGPRDKFNFGYGRAIRGVCNGYIGVVEIDEEDREVLEKYGFDKQLLERTQPLYSCWCDPESEFSWSYKTDIPHATFDIFDGKEKFCRGLVISVGDL